MALVLDDGGAREGVLGAVGQQLLQLRTGEVNILSSTELEFLITCREEKLHTPSEPTVVPTWRLMARYVSSRIMGLQSTGTWHDITI